MPGGASYVFVPLSLLGNNYKNEWRKRIADKTKLNDLRIITICLRKSEKDQLIMSLKIWRCMESGTNDVIYLLP